MAKNTPNIVLIVIDAGRPDHFSCYNSKRNTTPYIDSLSKKGVIYDSAFTTGGWTLPTMSSLFTGTYVSKHGAHNENHLLSDSLPTLSEFLSKNGYETITFSQSIFVGKETRLNRGFNTVINSKKGTLFDRIKGKVSKKLGIVSTTSDKGANNTVNQLIKKVSQTKDNPFFMYLHFGETHIPYKIPKPYNTKFLDKGISYREAMKIDFDRPRFYAGITKLGKSDFKVMNDLYDQALNYLDYQIGRIISCFEENSLFDDTLFIVTSDHGESLGEHNHLAHWYTLYDTIVKVPLIVKYPKNNHLGVRCKELVQIIDIFPTIADILGDSSPETVQGTCLPPSKRHMVRDFTISERFKDNFDLASKFPQIDLKHLYKYEKDRKTALRTKDFKLIWSELGNHELYDMSKDPNELKNVFKEKTSIAKDLISKLEDWKTSFEPYIVEKGHFPVFESSVRQELEDLGYLSKEK